MKSPSRYIKKTILLAVIIGAAGYYLHNRQPEPTVQGHPRDYVTICKDKTLRVATEYNSIGFHIDKDSFSGFHYELVQIFARAHGLKAKITPVMSIDQRLKGLTDGQFDLIACDIPTTNELKDSLLFTLPIARNREILVQRKPSVDNDSLYIRNQLQLAGRTLYVVKDSPSILRIHNLSNEIAEPIYVKEIEKYGQEQLIAMVAHGDIDYAVCNEHTALALSDSLPQIDMQTAIGFTQLCSWAVSKQSPVLLDSLNAWLTSFRQSDTYRKIYRKYYPRPNKK